MIMKGMEYNPGNYTCMSTQQSEIKMHGFNIMPRHFLVAFFFLKLGTISRKFNLFFRIKKQPWAYPLIIKYAFCVTEIPNCQLI